MLTVHVVDEDLLTVLYMNSFAWWGGWDEGVGTYEQDEGRAPCPEAYIVWCVY